MENRKELRSPLPQNSKSTVRFGKNWAFRDRLERGSPEPIVRNNDEYWYRLEIQAEKYQTLDRGDTDTQMAPNPA